MPHQFSIALLGGFGTLRDGVPIEMPPGCQRVVALAAVARGTVDRDWMCATLWPGVPMGSANARLRAMLWRLRCCGAEDILESDAHSISVGRDVLVDWSRAIQLSLQVLSDLLCTNPPDPEQVSELRPLLDAGDLLEGWPDDWSVRERQRYRALRDFTRDRLSSRSPVHAIADDTADDRRFPPLAEWTLTQTVY